MLVLQEGKAYGNLAMEEKELGAYAALLYHHGKYGFRMTYCVTISISHPAAFRTTFFSPKGIFEALSFQINSVSSFLVLNYHYHNMETLPVLLRDFSQQDLQITNLIFRLYKLKTREKQFYTVFSNSNTTAIPFALEYRKIIKISSYLIEFYLETEANVTKIQWRPLGYKNSRPFLGQVWTS